MICPKCTSLSIVKEGTRKRKTGRIQEYSCNSCHKWFVVPVEKEVKGERESIFLEDIEPGDILEYKTDKVFRLYCATDVHQLMNIIMISLMSL